MQSRRVWPRAATVVLGFMALLLLHSMAFAQMTGTITGTVLDKTGAVVPNAKVFLINQQNGITRQTVSSGDGHFTFAAVAPGTNYIFKVSAATFATWQSQPFAVRPTDALTFSNIRLEVAAAAEQVTVEAPAEAVKVLTSGERSDTITSTEIKTLSVVGRDATELIKVLPGFVIEPGDNQVNNKPSVNSRVVGNGGAGCGYNGNGTKGASNILLDGVNLTDVGTNCGASQDVNLDQVEEVKVLTSSYGADNNKGPVVINATGKSGTSAYHGSAYFQARNQVMASNDWLNNRQGLLRPDGGYYYPGASLGGPVVIPGTGFNKNKDKLFFFVGVEAYRQQYPGDLLQAWVPTDGMRAGDFSAATLNAELCGPRPDGKVNTNALQMMCQTQNYLPDGTLINSADITPYFTAGGQAIMKLFPRPNANPLTSAGGYNYINQIVQNQNGTQFHARIDYNINDNNKLFGSYNRQGQLKMWPVMLWWTPANSMPFPGDMGSRDNNQSFSINWARVFTPTLTNELVASINYSNSPSTLGNPDAVDRTKLGYNYKGIFKDTGETAMPALEDWIQGGFPQMLMPGGFGEGAVHVKQVVPNLSDTVSWAKGAHLLKAGVFYEWAAKNQLADWSFFPQGYLRFNPWYYMWNGAVGGASNWNGCNANAEGGSGRLSGAASDGNCFNPVAQILMGYPDFFQQSNFMPTTRVKYNSLAWFVTDSWKLNRRLTLDFGARFEHLSPWFDMRGNGLATFDPALYAQQCPGTSAIPGWEGSAGGRACTSPTPGLTWHSVNSSISNAVVSPAPLFVSPRFGFAWDVLGRGDTMLRGGFGFYRYHEEYNPFSKAAASATGYMTVPAQPTLFGTYSAYTYDSIEAQGAGGVPISPDGDVYALDPHDNKMPVNYNYNLTISQKLPWNSLMEVAYVGSKSDNLNSGTTFFSNVNMLPIGALFQMTPEQLAAIPGTPTDLGNMQANQVDMFRKYPFYKGVYILNHDLYSNYNSLQLSWNKQTGMITFGANYTFSKTLAIAQPYTTWLPDPVNLRNDYNPAPWDRTNVFNVHYLVDLGSPVKGNKLLKGLGNGWQISGITTLQSGIPVASLLGGGFYMQGGVVKTQTLYQVQSARSSDVNCPAGMTMCTQSLLPIVWLGTPDYFIMPTVSCDPRSNIPQSDNGPAYMNPTCFGIPQMATNGQYRLPYMRGPAFSNSDLTIFKNFKVGEKRNLQFSFAAFNFLNHPLWSFNKNDTSVNLSLGTQNSAVPGQALRVTDLQHPDFGIANIKYGNRLVQLKVKFDF